MKGRLAAKNFAFARHQSTTEALRDSLRAHGQLVPVYKLGGVHVDGRRREALLQQLGRTPKVVHLRTHQEAARVLWTLHPIQAWLEYGEKEERSLKAHAEFFAVTLADVARIKNLCRPSPSDRGELGRWRANYKRSFERLQRYLARCRQGLEPITLSGVEHAIKLKPFKAPHRKN